MKTFAKRAVAVLLAVVLSLSLAGCYDENLTWAAKKGDLELPIGGYIYYLSVAYNEAASQIDTETQVLKAELDGKDAETWIHDRAQEYVNRFFWIDDEMERLGLEMTEDDYTTAQETTTSYWTYFGSSFEDYGVAQTSFDTAYSQYNVKYLTVFEALYGTGGEREIPEADLLDQYCNNYYNYEYFTVPLSTTAEDGTTTEMTDEEKATLTKRLEKTRDKILSGETEVTSAANDYALEIGEESSYQLGVDSVEDMKSNYLPDEFIEAVTTTEEGDVVVFEASGYMILLHLIPIEETVEDILGSEEGRLQLMIELKLDEYKEYVETTANSVEGIELNDKAIKRYKPSMFTDSSKNGTSSTASEETEESSEESTEEE